MSSSAVTPRSLRGDFEGSFTATPLTFAEKVQYPWLTPRAFNVWFLPDGS